MKDNRSRERISEAKSCDLDGFRTGPERAIDFKMSPPEVLSVGRR